MSVYRDGHELLLRRVEALQGEVDDRDASVTPAFWRCLTASLRQSLESLRTTLHHEVARDVSPQSLQERCHLLERYRTTFDEALSSLERGDDTWRSATPLVPTHTAIEALTDEDAQAIKNTSSLLRPFGVHDQSATRVGLRRWRWSFVVDRSPFVLLLERSVDEGFLRSDCVLSVIEVVTTVRPTAPLLRLRPSSFLPTLRLAGMEGFALLESEPGATALLAGQEFVAGLRAVARDDVPSLDVADGRAILQWRFHPSLGAIRGAVRCLQAVRELPGTPLRRPR